MIQGAKEDKAKVVFVQPQYARENAEIIAEEIGGAVIPINPLPEDYLASLEELAGALKAALK